MARPQRGAYRSLFSVLFDDPDYQHLAATSRLVLLTIRLCHDAGPSAIFRYYPETVATQTGLSSPTVSRALEQLAATAWIEYDAAVVWVRNGLRYDPAISLANANHRLSVERYLLGLPKSPVVISFCDYYHFAYPFAWDGGSHRDQGVVSSEEGVVKGSRERNKAHVVLSDDQFLATLKSNPAYHGINLDLELAKMDAWLLTPRGRRRKKTHQFIVNWLNNVDQAVAPNGHSPFDARTQENIRAGQAVLDRLKEQQRDH